MQLIEAEEEKLAELRKEAYANVFDMKKALQEGHVIMTVSEAYDREEESGEREISENKPVQEIAENPAEGTDKEKAENIREKEEAPDRDDFDWQFTEEELNSLVDQNWAAVKELANRKNQEIIK